MLTNSFTRTRTAPSGYEKVRWTFHGIRTFQCLASILVASINSFFMLALARDGYPQPWTFILLSVTSWLTLLCLTTTIIFHMLTGLRPRLNMMMNSVVLAFWVLGVILLTRWSSKAVTSSCAIWPHKDGKLVCHLYKVLYIFTLIGTIAGIAAVALDVHIHRLSTRFGTHVRLDNMDKPRVVDARGPYNDAHQARSTEDVDGYASRNSEAFEVPQAGYGAGASSTQSKGLLGGEGYVQSEAQFDFDTTYRGGHEERAFGAK